MRIRVKETHEYIHIQLLEYFASEGILLVVSFNAYRSPYYSNFTHKKHYHNMP